MQRWIRCGVALAVGSDPSHGHPGQVARSVIRCRFSCCEGEKVEQATHAQGNPRSGRGSAASAAQEKPELISPLDPWPAAATVLAIGSANARFILCFEMSH